MEEDIFDIENDPEMVALAKEAKDIQVPVPYVMPAFQPIPAPAPKPAREKYEHSPWLLSTRRTLAKAGVKFYDGYDYSYNRDRNRSVSKEHIYWAFTALMHNTIIPNAIIAERAGFEVDLKRDVYPAIKYAMRHRKCEAAVAAWEELARTPNWGEESILYPFNFYVKGILHKPEGDTVIPNDKRMSLREYFDSKVAKFVKSPKVLRFGNTPALNRIIGEYSKDRSIAELPYQELMDRFGVSRGTVSSFMKWVRERREAGRLDDGIVIPR